ncbi:GNAT family N-acetyltransferase [Fluviispira multicolorata]|uniref:GNAT family N-acetyltransferase n=1 Tax=Fluviispira multicolorata TaxID=2654512 RepID=A0A833JFR5_9BACT|nr:GNAT family protein [Fluviispira multicolorata]KAB8031751.1 GNAT family N-acetyltransferase [Fluviispira multicolorata]
MLKQFENCKLNGQLVFIRPLMLEDEGLLSEVFSPKLFEYFPINFRTCKDFISESLERRAHNKSFHLLILENKSGRAVGSTSFSNVSLTDKRLEIGSTFFGFDYQKLGYNVEVKLLLLQYLFEVLNLNRVEFKSDDLNTASKLAMEKLGFVKEGLFRNHMIMSDGRLRNSAYYSVIQNEWNHTKKIIIDRFNKKLIKYHF